MSLGTNSASTILDAEFVLRMDRVCDEFESAWLKGERRAIESVVSEFAIGERDEVVIELVRLERELREKVGEQPLRSEYEHRFPTVDFGTLFKSRSGTTATLFRPSSNSLPQIAGYEILERIGRGGMGVVHKARHLKLNRLVALKMIDGAFPSDEQLARFQSEAEAIALLQHPHIVQIHEVGEAHGHPFLALEYIEGETLADRLAGEPQPPFAAATLISMLARAVQVAHERGVVHRDLKPTNIMLAAPSTSPSWNGKSRTPLPQSESVIDNLKAKTEQLSRSRTPRSAGPSQSDVARAYGVPKITDFGLAKRLDDESHLTMTGAIVGTPSYMAPEQAIGKSAAHGPAIDVYSLGAILYEMLTGRPPFKAPTSLETLELVRTADPLPPTHLQPRVPRDLETICLKCLQKEPAARFESMKELADELDRFIHQEPIRTRPVGLGERALKWARRHPSGASLIALSCFMVIALVGVWGVFTQRLREQRREANLARVDAEKARDAAKSLQVEAVTARNEALSAKNDAVRARDEALEEKERTRRVTYAASIQLAHRAWGDGNIERMRSILEGQGCMPADGESDLRNWEWRFLASLQQTEIKSLTSPILDGPEQHADLAARGFNSVCFTPDGQKVLATDWLKGRGVHVFDVGTGQLERVLDEHEGTVQLAVFSPDGRSLFTAGRFNSNSYLRDGRTFETKSLLNHPQHVYGATFSPDSKWLFTTCWDKKIRIWDATTGELRREWQGSDFAIYSIAISPDGRHMATTGAVGVVKLWSPDPAGIDRPWHEVARFTGHRTQVTGLAFSPDNETFATSCEAGEIRLWSVRERRLLSPIYEHSKWVYQLQFSPDGRWLLACSDDKTVSLIDPQTFRVARRLRGHSGNVRGVAVSPDGELIATAGLDRQIKIWDAVRRADEFEELAGPPHRKNDMLVMPDGKLLATACRDGQIYLWDMQSRTVVRSLPMSNIEVGWLGVSPDGRWLAAVAHESTPVIKVWDTRTWKVAHELAGHSWNVISLTFSPDSQWLASASYDSTVRLWNMQTGQMEPPISGLVGRAIATAWMPDGKRLLIGGQYEDLVEWDIQERRVTRRFGGHALGIVSMLLFDEGRRVAVVTNETQVRIWNLETERTEHTMPGQGGPITRMAVSADNERLFTSSYDNTLRVWDTRTGYELMTFTPAPEIEYSMAFDSAEQSLFASSSSGIVRVWKPRSDVPALDRPISRGRSAQWHEQQLRESIDHGRGATAVWHLERLAERDAEHPLLLRYEAEAAARMLDWNRAARALTEEIARHFTDSPLSPDQRQQLVRAAFCWRMTGNERAYRDFVTQQLDRYDGTNHDETLNSLAWLCTFGPIDGEFANRAIQLAEKAVALRASNLNVNTLATVHLAADRNVEAIAGFERSIALNPSGVGRYYDYYGLAIAQHRLGNHSLARDWFERARAIWRSQDGIRSTTSFWTCAELELLDSWALAEMQK